MCVCVVGHVHRLFAHDDSVERLQPLERSPQTREVIFKVKRRADGSSSACWELKFRSESLQRLREGSTTHFGKEHSD